MPFPSVTYTFANSTTADATQVNQNYTDLINGVSDGTKNISVSAGTFAGTLNAQGAVTLGASSSNLITWNGSLNSSIAIGTTNSYDIGSDTFGLRALYMGSGSSAHSTKLAGASVSVAYTFTLPNGGGTSRYRLQTDGAGVTSWDPVRRSGGAIDNIGLAASVSTNAMTVTLNTSAGSGSSATDPIDVVFRSSTATTGTPITRTSTGGAITLTIPSGATLGTMSNKSQAVYVYLLDNAGTIELAVAGSNSFDESTLQSSTSITSGSTSATVLYSTTGRSNVGIRYIGRILSTQVTAGTWAASPSEISVSPIVYSASVYASYYISAATQTPGANTQINFDTLIKDTHSAVTTGAGAWKFTAPVPGEYLINVHMKLSSTGGEIQLFKNGSVYSTPMQFSTNIPIQNGTEMIDLLAGDTIDLRTVAASVVVGGTAPKFAVISIMKIGS